MRLWHFVCASNDLAFCGYGRVSRFVILGLLRIDQQTIEDNVSLAD